MTPRSHWLCLAGWLLVQWGAAAAPVPQAFFQEVAHRVTNVSGARLIVVVAGEPMVFAEGTWLERSGENWSEVGKAWRCGKDGSFVFPDSRKNPVVLTNLAWRDVVQVLHAGSNSFVAARGSITRTVGESTSLLPLPTGAVVQQIAASPSGELHLAANVGLFRLGNVGWEPIRPLDSGERLWAGTNVLGVAFDSAGRLWFATKAGVGCRTADGWKFYEGRDGLP